MTVVAGAVWRDGRFEEGWLEIDAGHIVSSGQGNPPRAPVARGVVVPSLVNAHTHVADRLARGRVPEGLSLEEAVAPPNGVKHRLLAAATAAQTEDAIAAALAEAHAAGSSVVVDFREGGVNGALRLARAASRGGARPVALARPAAGAGAYDAAEVDALLDYADGLGLSALRDAPPEPIAKLAAHARRRGKRLALHWSEAERESVDALLDLAPDFVVHAVHATRDDVERLADARVPVVLCPRSNARLVGRLPDVSAMREAGVTLAIGTDNAMFQTLSVPQELAFLRERAELPDAALLAMAVDAPRAALAPPGLARGLAAGERADVVVFRARGPNPFAAVIADDAEVVWRPQA